MGRSTKIHMRHPSYTVNWKELATPLCSSTSPRPREDITDHWSLVTCKNCLRGVTPSTPAATSSDTSERRGS